MTGNQPVTNQTAETVVWKALAALHGVPAHLWWDKFQSVLEAHGYVVAHVEDRHHAE